MFIPILTVNRQNSNGRTYPESEVLKGLPTELLLFDSCDEHAPLDRTIGVAKNFKIENDKLIADVTFFETPLAKMIQEAVVKNQLSIRTSCYGNVCEAGVVSDINFINVFVTDNPSY